MEGLSDASVGEAVGMTEDPEGLHLSREELQSILHAQSVSSAALPGAAQKELRRALERKASANALGSSMRGRLGASSRDDLVQSERVDKFLRRERMRLAHLELEQEAAATLQRLWRGHRARTRVLPAMRMQIKLMSQWNLRSIFDTLVQMQNAFERFRDEEEKSKRMREQRRSGLKNLLRGAAHKMGGAKSAQQQRGVGGLASLLSSSMHANRSRDAAALALGLPSEASKGGSPGGKARGRQGAPGEQIGTRGRATGMRSNSRSDSDSSSGRSDGSSDDSDPEGLIGSTLDTGRPVGGRRQGSSSRGASRNGRHRKDRRGSAMGRRRSETEQDELAGIVRALVSTARANRNIQQKVGAGGRRGSDEAGSPTRRAQKSPNRARFAASGGGTSGQRRLISKPTDGPGMWTALQSGKGSMASESNHGGDKLRPHASSMSLDSDVGFLGSRGEEVEDDVRTLASEESVPIERDSAEEGGIQVQLGKAPSGAKKGGKQAPQRKHRQSIRTAGGQHAQKGAESAAAGQEDGEAASPKLDESIMAVSRRLRDIAELGKLADPGVKAAGHAAAAAAGGRNDDTEQGLQRTSEVESLASILVEDRGYYYGSCLNEGHFLSFCRDCWLMRSHKVTPTLLRHLFARHAVLCSREAQVVHTHRLFAQQCNARGAVPRSRVWEVVRCSGVYSISKDEAEDWATRQPESISWERFSGWWDDRRREEYAESWAMRDGQPARDESLLMACGLDFAGFKNCVTEMACILYPPVSAKERRRLDAARRREAQRRMRLGTRAGSSAASQPASEVQLATLDAIAAAHATQAGKPSLLRRALPTMTGSSSMGGLAGTGGVQLGGPDVSAAGQGKSIANLYSADQRQASISFLTSSHLVPAMHAASCTGIWGFESIGGKMLLSRGVRDCLIEHENAIKWMFQRYSTDIVSQPTRSATDVEAATKDLKLASLRSQQEPQNAQQGSLDVENGGEVSTDSPGKAKGQGLQPGMTPSIARFFSKGPPKTPGGRSTGGAFASPLGSSGVPDILGRADYVPPAPMAEPRLLQYVGVLELCQDLGVYPFLLRNSPEDGFEMFSCFLASEGGDRCGAQHSHCFVPVPQIGAAARQCIVCGRPEHALPQPKRQAMLNSFLEWDIVKRGWLLPADLVPFLRSVGRQVSTGSGAYTRMLRILTGQDFAGVSVGLRGHHERGRFNRSGDIGPVPTSGSATSKDSDDVHESSSGSPEPLSIQARHAKLLEPGAKVGNALVDAARTRQALESVGKGTIDLSKPARHFPAPGGGVRFDGLMDALRAAEEMSEHSQLASLSLSEFAVFLSVVARTCLTSKHRIEAAEAMIQESQEAAGMQPGGIGLSEVANDGARLRYLLLHIAGPHYQKLFGHPLRGRPLQPMVLHQDHEKDLVIAELRTQLRRAFYVYSRLDGMGLVDQIGAAMLEGQRGKGPTYGVRFQAFLLFTRDIGLFRSLPVETIKHVFLHSSEAAVQAAAGEAESSDDDSDGSGSDGEAGVAAVGSRSPGSPSRHVASPTKGLYPGTGTSGGSSAARNMLQRQQWQKHKKGFRLSYRAGLIPTDTHEQNVEDFCLSMQEFEKGVEMLCEEAYMLGQRGVGQRNPAAFTLPVTLDSGITPQGLARRALIARMKLLFETYRPVGRVGARGTAGLLRARMDADGRKVHLKAGRPLPQAVQNLMARTEAMQGVVKDMHRHEWEVAVRTRARDRGAAEQSRAGSGPQPPATPMRGGASGRSTGKHQGNSSVSGSTFRPFGVADRGGVDDWTKHRASLVKAAGPSAPRPPPSTLTKPGEDSPARRYRRLRGGRRMSGTMLRGTQNASRERSYGIDRVAHNQSMQAGRRGSLIGAGQGLGRLFESVADGSKSKKRSRRGSGPQSPEQRGVQRRRSSVGIRMYDDDDPLASADPESIAAAVVQNRRKSISKTRSAAEKAVALMMRGMRSPTGRRGSDITLGGEGGGVLGGGVAKRALMQASVRATERVKLRKHREEQDAERKREEAARESARRRASAIVRAATGRAVSREAMQEWREQEGESPRTPHVGGPEGHGVGGGNDGPLARFAASGSSLGREARVPFAANGTGTGTDSPKNAEMSMAMQRARKRQAAEENRRNADALMRGAQQGADSDGHGGAVGHSEEYNRDPTGDGDEELGYGRDSMPMEAQDAWRAREQRDREAAMRSAKSPWLGRAGGGAGDGDASSVGGSTHAAAGMGGGGAGQRIGIGPRFRRGGEKLSDLHVQGAPERHSSPLQLDRATRPHAGNSSAKASQKAPFMMSATRFTDAITKEARRVDREVAQVEASLQPKSALEQALRSVPPSLRDQWLRSEKAKRYRKLDEELGLGGGGGKSSSPQHPLATARRAPASRPVVAGGSQARRQSAVRRSSGMQADGSPRRGSWVPAATLGAADGWHGVERRQAEEAEGQQLEDEAADLALVTPLAAVMSPSGVVPGSTLGGKRQYPDAVHSSAAPGFHLHEGSGNFVEQGSTGSVGLSPSRDGRGAKGESKAGDVQEAATRMLAMMPRGKWAVEHSTLNGMMREQLLSDLGEVSEKPNAIYKVLKQAGGQLPLRRLLRAQERGVGVSAAAKGRRGVGGRSAQAQVGGQRSAVNSTSTTPRRTTVRGGRSSSKIRSAGRDVIASPVVRRTAEKRLQRAYDALLATSVDERTKAIRKKRREVQAQREAVDGVQQLGRS